MTQHNEYAVVRDNEDKPVAYARSERMARDVAADINADEAAAHGCKVADLAFPAYVKQTKWDDEG
jgi:hypothetical protein